MNRNDKAWDEQFRNRLEHYAPDPPLGVWERIAPELAVTGKPARPHWYRWAAVAAILLVALVTGLLVLQDPRQPHDFAETALTPSPGTTPGEPSGAIATDVTADIAAKGTAAKDVAAKDAMANGTATHINAAKDAVAKNAKAKGNAAPAVVLPASENLSAEAVENRRGTEGQASVNAAVSPAGSNAAHPGKVTIPSSDDLKNGRAGARKPGVATGGSSLSGEKRALLASAEEPPLPAGPLPRPVLALLNRLDGRVQNDAASGAAALRLRSHPKQVTLQPAVSPEWLAQAAAGDERRTGHQNTSHGDERDWTLGMMLTPAYASYSVNHSQEYARNMTRSASHAQANIGAGIAVSYKASSRWKIESGVYYSRSGDASENLSNLLASDVKYDYANLAGSSQKYFNTTVTLDRGEMAMNSTAGVINFSKTPSNAGFIALPESFAGVTTAIMSPGTFYQVFDFMEIPLTARYRIIDKTVALELISGLSTNLVVGNSVWADNGPERENVGKTADISPVNLSGIMGIGIICPLGNHLSLSVEPRASYFLHSMNHGGAVDFRPWKTALYTGVTWNF